MATSYSSEHMPAAQTTKKLADRFYPSEKFERYARAIESMISDPDLAKAVRAGFPIRQLDAFRRLSGLPWDALAKALRLPERTLARRRKTGRLSMAESDRLARIAQLFERATVLLQGNSSSAAAWFLGPCRALGGQSPLSVAETEIGAAQVEQLLGRLEHGVFS
jgi:putative toxin-antitoxin system antitoxin component (TIGR02293 family)